MNEVTGGRLDAPRPAAGSDAPGHMRGPGGLAQAVRALATDVASLEAHRDRWRARGVRYASALEAMLLRHDRRDEPPCECWHCATARSALAHLE